MDTPTEVAREARYPRWAAALTDEDAFRQEQARLGRVWTLLGVTFDVARDGDWFTAELGGRSVFVQRFGDQLKGFENRCAHRFYPLRTSAAGNGPIRCGFHHWTYDEEGRAVLVPRCREFYGVSPKQLNARIAPIEVATCGALVFGRFQNPHADDTLAEYLGDGVPIIEAFASPKVRPRTLQLDIAANWKLCYHITLDDYHSPAVHPSTFGQGGYLPRKALRYVRFGAHGAHNAFLSQADENGMQDLIAACRDGSYRPAKYRIFQFFPNLLIAQFRAQRWYVNVQIYVPVAPGRSLMRSWWYPAPFDAGRGRLRRLYDSATEVTRRPVVEHYIRKVHSEDNAVIERLQQFARQQAGWPRLSYAEERIKWFEETYARALAD